MEGYSSEQAEQSGYYGYEDPTIYQYNAAEEEWKTLPVNMSKPLYGEIPILIDLDMFQMCTVDRH